MDKINWQEINKELTELNEKLGQLQKEQTALVHKIAEGKKAEGISDSDQAQEAEQPGLIGKKLLRK